MVTVTPAITGLLAQVGLAGAQGEQGAKIEPILLIHGTFANKLGDGPSDWWRPDSEFCGNLDALLGKMGAAARCWANGKAFAWTGENSELARREAGRTLGDLLDKLETDTGTTRYHLIGHSHGGNVILNALNELSRKPAKLGAVVFMGTPVLTFGHLSRNPRWIAIPLYIIALIALGTLFPSGPNAYFWFIATTIISALMLEFRFLYMGSTSVHGESELYGSGRTFAFVFPCDEAIVALESAQKIIRKPKDFIAQFIQPMPKPDYAIKPWPEPRTKIRSHAKQTAAYSLLQNYYFWGSPESSLSVKGLAQMILGASGVERFNAESWSNVLNPASWFLAATILVLWLCAIVPSLIMVGLVVVCSFVWQCSSAVYGWFVLRIAKLLGRWALPRLVRKAVFGQDQGKFSELSRLPPCVINLQPMSDELVSEATRINQLVGQHAAQGVQRAITDMDAFAIKARVTDALTNTALAHSYYYKAAEIRERIAQLIATLPQPRPLEPLPLQRWVLRAAGVLDAAPIGPDGRQTMTA